LYYNAAMTLTVRLPDPLERALDEYCAAHGTTKSHVVQECLAQYLVRPAETGAPDKGVSGNFAAFKRAGLLGCATGDGVSATNEVVRKRVLERLKARR
jgi:predicted transcriptional regulator